MRAWKRAVEGPATADQLREGAVRYRNNPKRDPDYTKYAERWINAGGYLDDGVVLRPAAHDIGTGVTVGSDEWAREREAEERRAMQA